MKPNHHYLTHIFDQIEDYGPVYGFWTFLFERLNKVLKNYAQNNHAGGELEVTFFRECSREGRLRVMVSIPSKLVCLLITQVQLQELGTEPAVAAETSFEDIALSQIAQVMLGSNIDRRGTVAGLAAMAEKNHQVSDESEYTTLVNSVV